MNFNRRTVAFLSFLTLLSPLLEAQTTTIVQDINQAPRGTEGSFAHEITAIGSKVFFVAYKTPGFEDLYMYDRTTKTTVAVNGNLTEVESLTALGSELFFFAKYSNTRYLCASNGMPAIRFVAIVSPAAGQLTRAGQRLFFADHHQNVGRELWVSDGRSAKIVRDIRPGVGDSGPIELTPCGNLVFFRADDGTHGRELWRSDGTKTGTVLLKDIDPSGSSYPTHFASYYDVKARQHTLLFSVVGGNGAGEPWISDGTTAGTQLLKDIQPGSAQSKASQFQFDPRAKLAFFTASTPNEGEELWKTDGTTNGTVLVKDIRKGKQGSRPHILAIHAGQAYLSTSEGVSGNALWISDGSASGTKLVSDISPGPAPGSGADSAIITSSGQLMFWGGHPGYGLEPWISDGTASGTAILRDVLPGPIGSRFVPSSGLFVRMSGSEVWFVAHDGIHGHELWTTNGTTAGTRMLFDFNTAVSKSSWTTQGSAPGAAVSLLDGLYFAADDGTNGRQLWKSNGPATATEAVTTITGDPRTEQLTAVGDRLFFTAVVLGKRRLSVKTGNTTRSFFSPTDPDDLTAVGDTLFFTCPDSNKGSELWKSDGTGGGTVMVKDIQPGAGSASPRDLVAFRGQLYFVAHHGAYGEELWRSDGTAAGTVLVKDILTGPPRSAPQFLSVIGDTLYFSAHGGVAGRELWKSDGTTAGTVLVKDIWPGSAGASPALFAPIGDEVLFVAGEPNTGRELWKSDGTAAGTVMIKDVFPGAAAASRIQQVTAALGQVFFSARDNLHGQELWVSDGTTAGTQMVKDIALGDSHPRSIVASGSRHVWFAAETPAHGRELWRSDGTAAGTTLMADVILGPSSSNPVPLGVVEAPAPLGRAQLLFAADDWVKGRELFRIELGASSRRIGQGCAPGLVAPTFETTDPTMGPFFTILSFRGRHARPGSSAFALFSAKPAAPLPFMGCSLYIDFAFAPLGPFKSTNGTWQGSAVVPTNPSLTGVTLASQGLVFPAPGPRGFDLTNGVVLTVGK